MKITYNGRVYDLPQNDVRDLFLRRFPTDPFNSSLLALEPWKKVICFGRVVWTTPVLENSFCDCFPVRYKFIGVVMR